MVLLPLAVVLPLLGLMALWWGSVAFDRLLQAKVRADLAVAQGYFERVLAEVGTGIAAVAGSHALHQALAAPAPPALVPLLQRFKAGAGLDFIALRSADGRLLATDSGRGDDSAEDGGPGGGDERTSVEVMNARSFARLGGALVERVRLPLRPTLNAAPTTRTEEDRAMVLLATRSVRDDSGRIIARLEGGVLLNRNLPFIDHINEIVYPKDSLPFGSRGTATLFLDDVRISTNVRLFGEGGERRAIGTRVSQEVHDAVLGQGRTWLGRAFVVSDWYVSAYQPLAAGDGRRVGMLYVGVLEAPFTRLKYATLASIGALFFAVMVAAAFVSLRWARAIFAPIERMEATMQRVEGGALEARVGALASDDEIGRLARHLDQLLGTLQRWNAELDAKVAERTRQLENAQAQLRRSEKLATVGQLTASIAHEVNNPIAVIQGNLDLLRELLPAEIAKRVRPELRLVDEQIERMRLIVTQLLQFARPGEFAGYVESVAPARALEDCLVLVAHLLSRTRIEVRRELAATRLVAINRQELQQVLVNLMVNAIAAMEGGGTLTLRSRDAGEDGVEIEVGDTGPGLAPERLGVLFQPCVTRKKDGTGLGLWISRGIVERYGGDLVAANAASGGACFTLRLKAEA
jgi:signal transduction histidine kinase